MNQRDRDRMARLIEAMGAFPMIRMPTTSSRVVAWIEEVRTFKILLRRTLMTTARANDFPEDAEEALDELEQFVEDLKSRYNW